MQAQITRLTGETSFCCGTGTSRWLGYDGAVHPGAAAKLGWRRRPACLDGLPIRAVIERSAHQTRRNIYVGGRKAPVRRWKGEFDGESREAKRHASGYRLTRSHCRTPSRTPLMNELLKMSKNESASASRTKIMQIITMRKPRFAACSPTTLRANRYPIRTFHILSPKGRHVADENADQDQKGSGDRANREPAIINRILRKRC